MRAHKFHNVRCERRMKRAGLRRCIAMTMFFVLLEFPLANCCTAAELKQKTIEAFDH
jgi:hypothetical protein